MDLRDLVRKIKLISDKEVEITLKSSQGESVRPFEAVRAIFGGDGRSLNIFENHQKTVRPYFIGTDAT